MALAIGIIGLPNVGKSTLFTALTRKRVPAENYAFTTIEPNVGVVAVPDTRLATLSQISHSAKTVPTTATFMDIAGLVKDAHKGEGLGNKFLSHIREVNAIVHVVRAFSDKDVTHVHGHIDPKNDYEVITTELALADLLTIENRLRDIEGKARSGDAQATKELAIIKPLREHVAAGKTARTFPISKEHEPVITGLHLLTAKPELIVYNHDETHIAEADTPGEIHLSAKLEAEIAELPEQDANEMLTSLGIKEPGLHRLIRSAYALLGLITFFTSGETESRAWSLKKGETARDAAGEIHSDFYKHFIKAEVTSYADYTAAGGELPAKQQGKTRTEGKTYIMQDGDVVFFHTSA